MGTNEKDQADHDIDSEAVASANAIPSMEADEYYVDDMEYPTIAGWRSQLEAEGKIQPRGTFKNQSPAETGA